MEWIDTHVHLEDEAFTLDRDAVFARAHGAGIGVMVNAGSAPVANAAALALAHARDDLYVGVGLHPHEFPRLPLAAVNDLPAQLCQEKVVALGEIGLDYHVFPDLPLPDRAAQGAGLEQQLRLARQLELPLILHVREAMEDMLALLRQHGPWPAGGVMHCYAGEVKHLPAVLDMGFAIGIGGPVTYPKADALRAVVHETPLDRLVLETDAPYLPPQGQRGKRNEPAWLAAVAEAVAKVKAVSLAELARQTTANAQRIFKLGAGREDVWVYAIRDALYINLTNRCCSQCCFCPRSTDRRVQGYELSLQREPRADELISAIGDPRRYREVVFCGFGEPLLRWPTLLAVAQAVKSRGGRVRVNTNGQAEALVGMDILTQAKGWVDVWSVSLNAANPEHYQRLMRPAAGPEAFAAATGFIRRALAAGFEVIVTSVEWPDVDTAAVRSLVESWGARYRGRTPQRLGDPDDEGVSN